MEERKARDLAAIAAVLRGDREAFAELATRYQRMIAAVAWRHGFRQEDVEDIVSEVLLKTYRNLHRYRPDFPFSTWLYRVAVHHVVDRTRRARKERGREELPAELADPSPGAGAALERDERAAVLREAVRELPSHYREPILVVYVEGLKIDEAARVLGIPVGTVKTRLMRGRAALKQRLRRRHPELFGGADAL